jgi:hypothetical protein
MNKLNYLKAVILLVSILIAPIKAVAEEKPCALGETCKVSCDYILVVPVTKDPNANYQCHVELGRSFLNTYFVMSDAAWWWDHEYLIALSYPSNATADMIFHDKLKSQAGTIKIFPACYTHYGVLLSGSGDETVVCTKINAA